MFIVLSFGLFLLRVCDIQFNPVHFALFSRGKFLFYGDLPDEML